MNSTKRMLPYVRQYVIVAVYDIMDQDGIKYKKTDSSTIVAEMSVYGNKSVFSIADSIAQYLENEWVINSNVSFGNVL